MAGFIAQFSPVHLGVSIVDNDAFQDYKKFSTIRDKKRFSYFSDYRKVARKIWKKVAEASLEHEGGAYSKEFFYLVPQVIANKPFIELPNGKIKSNNHTNGDIYTPIFCNLFERFNHFCWSLDGCFSATYTKKLREKIDKDVPKYYFLLPTILKNNL